MRCAAGFTEWLSWAVRTYSKKQVKKKLSNAKQVALRGFTEWLYWAVRTYSKKQVKKNQSVLCVALLAVRTSSKKRRQEQPTSL